MIIGPDISFWQDDPTTPASVDFSKLEKQSKWVIIRARQNLWSDKRFSINWSDAKKAGLARGSYWFYDSRADPKRQAEKWIETLSPDLGELPLFADFEENYKGNWAGWKHWYTCLEHLKMLAPYKEIVIYIGYYYWMDAIALTPKASVDYFAQYALWIAAYETSAPRLPIPWKAWTFWQFTDNGDGGLYGVESKNIDLNYFNGSSAEFRARFNLDEKPEEPEEEIPMTNYVMTTISSGTRIRTDHTTLAAVSMSVDAGVIVSSTQLWTAPADGLEVRKGDKWLYITHVGGVELANNKKGWMAYIHKGVPICNDFKEITNTSPTEPPVHTNVAVAVNIFEGEVAVIVNGKEYIQKT